MKYKNGVITEMLIFRNGTQIKVGVSDEIRYAIAIMDEISKQVAGKEAVVTSINDGSHGSRSWHHAWNRTPEKPDSRAVDFRNYIYTTSEQRDIYLALKDRLGKGYDVVPESNHFHIEYDPR